MKLIDKAAVVAEINKRIMDAPIDCYGHQRVWAYNDVKNILDTLEVKEVDESRYNGFLGKELQMVDDEIARLEKLKVKEVNLEKELDTWRHNHFHGRRDKDAAGEYLERSSQLDIAKHFFELGLKAQKV